MPDLEGPLNGRGWGQKEDLEGQIGLIRENQGKLFWGGGRKRLS